MPGHIGFGVPGVAVRSVAAAAVTASGTGRIYSCKLCKTKSRAPDPVARNPESLLDLAFVLAEAADISCKALQDLPAFARYDLNPISVRAQHRSTSRHR
jgi:hypothetical protein